MDTLPILRADVRLEELPSGGVAVFDALLGRRVKLDNAGAMIARALGGATDPVTIEALAVLAGVESDAVRKLGASLARLFLLNTAEANERAAVARMAVSPAAAVPIIARDDARFTCTMCGGCCGGHMVGPVSQKVLDGLDAEWPALERETGSHKGLFFTLPASEAAEVGRHVVCHASGGSCVFLTDDRKCLIHKRFGGDKKPEPCRIFPYEFIATPAGVVVTIQRECRGFLEARNGKRLVDDLPDIRAVLALVPARSKVGEPRHLDGRVLSWSAYEALEARLHAVVDEVGGDDRTIFGALAAVLGVSPVDAEPSELRQRLTQWSGAFLEVVTMIAGAAPPPDERVLVRIDGLEHLGAALRALRPDFRRLMLPLDRSDQKSLLVDHLHHALMGKFLVQAPTLEAGLGRLAAQWALAKVLAIVRAREVKRRHLVAQDLMDGLVTMSFMFRHADMAATIARLDPLTTELFVERHASLVVHAHALPDPDTRIELVKF